MSYLLHEHPMGFLVPSNESRNECEKIQLSNSFESILNEDVPYSIAVENIAAEETRNIFNVFFYIYSIWSI